VLPPGPGTLVLAAGLAATVGLVRAGRRHPAYRERLAGEAARALPRAAIAAGVLIVLVVAGMSALGWGELSAPVTCAVVGGCYLWAAGRMQRRGEALIGVALIGLAGLGVLAAVGTAGETYSRGLIGLGGGVVFWVTAALRVGLHRRLVEWVHDRRTDDRRTDDRRTDDRRRYDRTDR
jgi:hypothetical protein